LFVGTTTQTNQANHYIRVNFLENSEISEQFPNVPTVFHFGNSRSYVKSPKIPAEIEGIRVSMVLDTGAEVSILPISLLTHMKRSPPTETKYVHSLNGTLVPIKGPVPVEIKLCYVTLTHNFYFVDESQICLLGYDLISAAALVIDTEHKCVWSRMATPFVDESPSSSLGTERLDRSAHRVSQVDAFSRQLHPHSPATTQESRAVQTNTVYPCSSSLSLRGPRAIVASRTPPLYGNGCPVLPADDFFAPPPLSHSSLTFTLPLVEAVELNVDSGIGDRSPSCLPLETTDVFSPDVTLVKTAEMSTEMNSPERFPPNSEIDLPEHVNILFLQTVNANNLSSDVECDLKQLLLDHSDTFAKSSTDLGFCSLIEHDIDTGDYRPIKQSPRRPPLAARDAEDEILDEMLASGVIEPSTSAWASPVCLVPKKDGSFRFCIDYRKVNAVSKKDAYPLPDIQDALDNLKESKYFATIDLLSGYWQIGMTERAKERSAFCTRRGLFHFTRMPFGLSGAPGSFCRLMQIVLRDLLWIICLCYLDDIVLFAKTPQELLERLRVVLDRLRKVGLKCKPSKCELFKTEIKFFGHQVSVHGIEPLPDKIETIRDWPVPKCLRDVRAFYGLASYYRRFVQGFATIAEPLTRLTQKYTQF